MWDGSNMERMLRSVNRGTGSLRSASNHASKDETPVMSPAWRNVCREKKCFWGRKDPHCPGEAWCLLIQRVERENARFRIRALADWVDANHCVLFGAERTDASLIERDRSCQYGVTNIHSASDGSGAILGRSLNHFWVGTCEGSYQQLSVISTCGI